MKFISNALNSTKNTVSCFRFLKAENPAILNRGKWHPQPVAFSYKWAEKTGFNFADYQVVLSMI